MWSNFASFGCLQPFNASLFTFNSLDTTTEFHDLLITSEKEQTLQLQVLIQKKGEGFMLSVYMQSVGL